MKKLIILFLLSLNTGNIYAASCCGGSGGGSVTIPKFMPQVAKVGLSQETYDGFWNQKGEVLADPTGSNLTQTRFEFAYAKRLTPNLQANLSASWVKNDNVYSGVQSHTQGLGDTKLGLLYENFDNITCVNEITRPEDWQPANYYGLNLTLPTGLSPYDDVDSSFDITGRGFYALEATALVEKTVYPYTVSLNGGYTLYKARMINQETGNYVTPYKKQLGDRFSIGLTLSYTWFLDSLDQATLNLSQSKFSEDAAKINGATDPDTDLAKQSQGLSLGYATMDQSWVVTLGLNAALKQTGAGKNFPITNTTSLGLTHVFH
ncbi:MAG: hypothetical protein QNL04_15105 [SAR324 cluster bacterium]|nr:hypothetical protein [SAR324 cluster bacterium]